MTLCNWYLPPRLLLSSSVPVGECRGLGGNPQRLEAGYAYGQ